MDRKMTKKRRRKRRVRIPEETPARAVAKIVGWPVAAINSWCATSLARKGQARVARRPNGGTQSEWLIMRRAFCLAKSRGTRSGLQQRQKLSRERALAALSRAYQRALVLSMVNALLATGVCGVKDAVDLAVLTARRSKRIKIKVSPRSVMGWRSKYCQQGLAGLVGHYVPGKHGRPRKAVSRT